MISSKSLILLASLALAACSPPRSTPAINVASDAIIGGEAVFEGSELHTSIVGIYDHELGAICTGSLLPNNVVLTAAHCLGPNPSKMFIVFTNDLWTTLESQDEALVLSKLRQVSSYKAHTDWKPEVEGTSQNWNWNDIALLKFTGKVPKGFKAATFLTDATVLAKGAKVTLAGYGVEKMEISDIDPKTFPELDQAIERGEIVCSDDKQECLQMDSSGDGLLRSVEVKVSQVKQSEILVDQRNGKGSCSGDSGGPAYVQSNGKYYLWGITSRGDAGCEKNGVYTNALAYLDWIHKASANMK